MRAVCTEFGLSPCLDGWQDPGEDPRVEVQVVEGPERGQRVEQGAAHHHDQVVDRHHLKMFRGRELRIMFVAFCIQEKPEIEKEGQH